MPALFSDNFEGAAVDDIAGRVATGGTWTHLDDEFSATIGINGAGNAVAVGAADGSEEGGYWPNAYAVVPALNNISAGYVELAAAFSDDSAGQIGISHAQGWNNGIYISSGIYMSAGGPTVDVFAGPCSFSTSRAGRTSLAMRLEFEPGDTGMLYRLYADGELVDSKSVSGAPGGTQDVILNFNILGYAEDFNSPQATFLAVGERTLGPPPAFWTGLVNTYEVP